MSTTAALAPASSSTSSSELFRVRLVDLFALKYLAITSPKAKKKKMMIMLMMMKLVITITVSEERI